MKKTVALLTIALSFFLHGCVTSQNHRQSYKETLDSWLNSTEDELIAKWGLPNQVYNSGTKKYLVYQRSRVYYGPFEKGPRYESTYNPYLRTTTTRKVEGQTFHCKTTFTIERGVINDWRYQGNDCH